jgi:hypothetical protein
MSFSGTLPSASFLTFSYLFELMTGSEVHEQQISSLHNTLARTDDDGIDDQLCRIHSVNLLSMSLVSLLAHSLGSNTRTRIWLPLPQRSIQFDEDETWRDSRRLATGTTKRAILHCTSALCATPHTHAGQRRWSECSDHASWAQPDQLLERKRFGHHGSATIQRDDGAVLVEEHERGNALHVELGAQIVLPAALAETKRSPGHLFEVRAGVGLRAIWAHKNDFELLARFEDVAVLVRQNGRELSE